MTDDQFNFRVDGDLKDLAIAKADRGEVSERLRREIERMALGEEASNREVAKKRLEEVREEKEQKIDRREELGEEIERLEATEAELEEKIEQYADRQDEYESLLEMLDELLQDGYRADPGHGKVIRAARLAGTDEEAVIDELKDRNPDVPDELFTEGTQDAAASKGVVRNP